MSSYLSIYLVPKKNKIKYDWNNVTEKGPTEIEEKISEGKPLLLTAYCRNNEVYQAINETLNIKFIGTSNDEEDHYSTVLVEDMDRVLESIQEDIDTVKTRMENSVEAFNKLSTRTKEEIEDYVSEYCSDKEYLDELKETKAEVLFLRNILNDLEYTDFEQKFLMNIN